jgi:hypothetical protein
MKQQQKFITNLSLIVALTGLSPVMTAEASDGERLPTDQRQIQSPLRYNLSPEQIDNIHAGRSMEKDLQALRNYAAGYCETAICHISVMAATGATIQWYANGNGNGAVDN